MVRVISVHHFTKQDVTGLDRAGGHGVARGKGDLIFIGGQHKVDIRNLQEEGLLKGSFPTVDLVQQLVYCQKGNYVCTLESKPARHGGDHTYVRVYLNWENESSNQPMKARIAGKVTPGSQSGLEALEMVEIPTKKPIEYVACCQTTGNIALASGMSVSIFKFCHKTHDMSKMKFVDFEEMIEIDTAFIVTEVAIAEDIIGCVSDTESHIFQVVINAALLKTASETSEESQLEISPERKSASRSKSRSKSKTRSLSKSPRRVSQSSMAPFRGQKVVQKEAGLQLIRKADDYIDLSAMKWVPLLSYGKRPVQSDQKYILFPSLVGAAQCGVVTEPGEVHGPVSASQYSNVRIKLISGHGSTQRVSSGIFDAVTLIHRRIDKVSEPDLPFSNLRLNCVYNSTKDSKDGSPMSKNSTHPLLPMVGEKMSKKIGATVFLTTPHIGYLYHISLSSKPLESSVVRGGIFSYTAPVDTVALEPCLLHALTLTGLETYTLRPHPHIIESNSNGDHMIVPPHWEETVCLVGLRPFLNVESLTLTDSCLALIAANDEGGDKSHTVYSLHLPSAASLYKEMIRVGLGHRNASPSTYYHLLLEAYLVLLTAITHQPKDKNIEEIEGQEKEDILALLQDSSAFLGDYYASCTTEVEWNQAVQYYRASTLTPDAILERLPSDSPGLIHILTSILLHPNSPILNAAQANCILDTLEKIAPEQVSTLVLKSPCLKEFKKDKVLNIIKHELSKTSEPRPTDVFALALIILERGSPEQVSTVLSLLRSHQLVEIMLQHSRLLVEREEDQLRLSPFAQVLVEHKREVFMEVFVLLIGEGTISLNAFVDAFVSVYPIVSCGIECNVNSLRLRDLLENFFLEFGHLPELTDQKEKCGKAINVLISLYIASLLGAFNSEVEEEKGRLEQRSVWINLFGERPSYLNYLPPFQSKAPPSACKHISVTLEDKSGKHKETSAVEDNVGEQPSKIVDVEVEENTENKGNTCVVEPENIGESICNCRQCCVHLLLLQSLLSSELPSSEDRATVLKFACSNPQVRGASSLQLLCLDSPKQVTYLMEHHPDGLLQYCKDTYESPWEWEAVVTHLIDCVNKLEKEDPKYEQMEKILNEILSELAVTSSFEEYTEILPKLHHDQFRYHIRQCHSAGMAQYLKDVFVSYADNVLKEVYND